MISLSPASIFSAISISPSFVKRGTLPIVSMYILRGSFLPRSSVVADFFRVGIGPAGSSSSELLATGIFKSSRTSKRVSMSSIEKSSSFGIYSSISLKLRFPSSLFSIISLITPLTLPPICFLEEILSSLRFNCSFA